MPKFNRIKTTSTLQQLIMAGKHLQYTADKISLKDYIKRDDGSVVVFNLYSLTDRYMDDLEQFIMTIELSDSEYLKYRFQPKKLCLDVYNCPDLAPLILKINNMVSLLEFDKQSIRMFKTNILKLLNEIKILEQEQYNANEGEISKIINGTK
jgi:hypothetical protein